MELKVNDSFLSCLDPSIIFQIVFILSCLVMMFEYHAFLLDGKVKVYNVVHF